MRNENGALEVSDDYIHIHKKHSKSFHKKLLKTEFACDRNRLFQEHIVNEWHCFMTKYMHRKLIGKTKKRNAAEL